MTEDTRKWANANAGTPRGLASAITDFSAAQRWEKQAQTQEQESDFTQADFKESLDEVSAPQTPERA